ncbi:MAG: hypothetical protein V3W41_17440 [Planctomycetota bacterium]
MVLGPNGERLAGLRIRKKGSNVLCFSDEQGQFSFATKRGTKVDLSLGELRETRNAGRTLSPFQGEVKDIVSPQGNVVIHAKRVREKGRRITVFVEDIRGLPLKGALVKSGGYHRAYYSEHQDVTDDKGMVVFQDLPKKVLRLFASPGRNWEGRMLAPSDPIVMQDSVTEYRAVMLEARWIRGHVRNQNDEPIIGARVHAWHNGQEHSSDDTTATGSFELLVRTNLSYELRVRDLQAQKEIARLPGVSGTEANIVVTDPK